MDVPGQDSRSQEAARTRGPAVVHLPIVAGQSPYGGGISMVRSHQTPAQEIPQDLTEYIDRYVLPEEVKEQLRTFVQEMAALNMSISTDEIDAKVDEIMAMRDAEKEMDSATTALALKGGMSNDELRLITLETARELSVGAGDAGELGTGFKKLEAKSQLVGQGFLILTYRFFEGQKGIFAAVFVITDDGRKLLLTDGSTGIRAQLEEWTEQHNGEVTRMICRNGLRVSTYKVCDTCNKVRGRGEEVCPNCGASGAKEAETYYLDENA